MIVNTIYQNSDSNAARAEITRKESDDFYIVEVFNPQGIMITRSTYSKNYNLETVESLAEKTLSSLETIYG